MPHTACRSLFVTAIHIPLIERVQRGNYGRGTDNSKLEHPCWGHVTGELSSSQLYGTGATFQSVQDAPSRTAHYKPKPYQERVKPAALPERIVKRDKEVVRLTPDNLNLHRPATPCGDFGIYQDFADITGFLLKVNGAPPHCGHFDLATNI